MTRRLKHEGTYRMLADGVELPAGRTIWEAYASADAARERGAERVEVYMDGLEHGPVFALAPRPSQSRERDRIRNTVDPDLWVDVIDRILSRTGKT